MKQSKTKLCVFFILISAICVAQPGAGHWKLGGNSNFPAIDNILLPGNNFLGSAPAFNVPLIIGVNGSQDIFIDNNPGQLLPASTNNPGFLQGGHWVGLGRIFGPSTGVGAVPLESQNRTCTYMAVVLAQVQAQVDLQLAYATGCKQAPCIPKTATACM